MATTTTRDEPAAAYRLALPDALADQRLMFYYQPVVRMATGCVQYYEALLRLSDCVGRVMQPAQFLPYIQRLGLMPGITRWAIATAIGELRARPHVKIHVNLHSECIGDPDLLAFVADQVHDIAPGRLGFEMTEDTVVADMSTTADWILKLKALGCRFVIDDFGAGNTATVVLVNLPVDSVKIDGALVTAMISDRDKRSLVEAVTAMAKGQKKDVVAEWVESEAIAVELLDIGIENGQGYFFGSPGPGLPKRMGRRRAVRVSDRAAT